MPYKNLLLRSIRKILNWIFYLPVQFLVGQAAAVPMRKKRGKSIISPRVACWKYGGRPGYERIMLCRSWWLRPNDPGSVAKAEYSWRTSRWFVARNAPVLGRTLVMIFRHSCHMVTLGFYSCFDTDQRMVFDRENALGSGFLFAFGWSGKRHRSSRLRCACWPRMARHFLRKPVVSFSALWSWWLISDNTASPLKSTDRRRNRWYLKQGAESQIIISGWNAAAAA